MLNFRSEQAKREFTFLHPRTRKLAFLLGYTLDALDYDAEVTSMVRPVDSIPGESGVHATGRAIDIVPRYRAETAFRAGLFVTVTEYLNKLFKRIDGHFTVIYHDRGSGFHFHIQVPTSKDYKDLDGSVPAEDA